MTYIPHTDHDRQQMLAAIGVKTLDDLFKHLPADVKAAALKLPPGLGATAAVEGCQMALRHTGRTHLLVDGAIHPHYLQAMHSLLRVQGITMDVIAPKAGEFRSDLKALASKVNEHVAGVVAGYPNFYG